ncbi:ethanolamine-phosphate cytidylyltransferase [Acrasis kona]|uniref:ethanolamine-phosphate cytidylyltransferase n=1 Tax=Acrasis kona TaxID=1008807 RepID=A0AAW2YX32_9EUKA
MSQKPSKYTISKITEFDKEKTYKIWVDGCFDMMHFGHANAIRQAKKLFPNVELFVGVHTDEDIRRHKGPPVMNEQERYEAVRSCKWVDHVVEGAPYVTQVDVLKSHGIDFCVHGEDISFDEDGEDTYKYIHDAGMMLVVKRTEGVSSTDIVERMLKLAKNKENQQAAPAEPKPEDLVFVSPYTKMRQFLPTTHKITQFQENPREPTDEDVIVFVDGGFDLFHTGHIEFLKRAKELGTYLIVGLHDDNVITQVKGTGYPIMNLHERVLGVLSCRYVDDVIIGAPFVVTKDVLDSLNVNVVVQGTVWEPECSIDPFELPKKFNIYKQVQSPRPDLTTTEIVKRIIDSQSQFEARNAKKQKKEAVNLQRVLDEENAQ